MIEQHCYECARSRALRRAMLTEDDAEKLLEIQAELRRICRVCYSEDATDYRDELARRGNAETK